MAVNVLFNVAIMFIYMGVGFTVCKAGVGTASHAKSLSGILIYVLGPCMVINAFINTEYSTENIKQIGQFFIATLAIQLLFFFILYFLFHKKYAEAKYRILTVGSVLGNVGFLGLPLITGLFPDQPIVACYSSIYVMSMNILVFTVGGYLITNDKSFISIKSIFTNPTSIALYISLPLYIFQIQPPAIITEPIAMLGKMVTPVCMFVLGMRLSSVSIKAIFSRPFVYLCAVAKLFIFPAFGFLCVCWLPVSDLFKISVVTLSSVPSAAVIESLAELYETEQELTSNVVLLTTLLCIITIPIVVSLSYFML